jgi:hypothetical protein
MTIRCNVCSIEIDEKDVDSHTSSTQHIDAKSKISTNGKGLEKSVIDMWYNSLG